MIGKRSLFLTVLLCFASLSFAMAPVEVSPGLFASKGPITQRLCLPSPKSPCPRACDPFCLPLF